MAFSKNECHRPGSTSTGAEPGIMARIFVAASVRSIAAVRKANAWAANRFGSGCSAAASATTPSRTPMVSPTSMGPTHRLIPWPVRVPWPLLTGIFDASVVEKVDALNGFSPIWNQKNHCRHGRTGNTRGQTEDMVYSGRLHGIARESGKKGYLLYIFMPIPFRSSSTFFIEDQAS